MATKVKFLQKTLKPITLNYNHLLDPTIDLSKQIQASFGQSGNGILLINNIPKYIEYKQKLLPLAHKIHMFPPEIKKKHERPQVFYAVGICTYERLTYKGVRDMATSWYCNSLVDKMQPTKYIKNGKEVIGYYQDNFWPSEDLPQLQPAFKNMGKLTSEVGYRLSIHIQKLIKNLNPNYKIGQMKGSLDQPIGRLVHYHTAEEFQQNNKGQAVYWHADGSSLTTLCSPIYIDQNERIVDGLTDQAGQGLEILRRDKSLNSCCIPSDCLAFQTGQILQIISGGKLQATPHRVVANKYPKYTRQQFVNFFLPKFDYKLYMPQGTKEQEIFQCQSDVVLDIKPRWTNGIYFKDFFDQSWKYFV